MSSNWITVTTILGSVVDPITHLFSQWDTSGASAKTIMAKGGRLSQAGLQSINPTDGLVRLANLIEHNASGPPVVFFHRYIDTWSICPGLTFRDMLGDLKSKILYIQTEAIEAALYPTAEASSIGSRIESFLNRGGEFDVPPWEVFQFFSILKQSMTGWRALVDKHHLPSATLAFFQSVGPSVLDGDVVAATQAIPDWFNSLLH